MPTKFNGATRCQLISSAGCWQCCSRKMVPPKEKSFHLLHYNETRSATALQWAFQTKYPKTPVWGFTTKWYKQFVQSECICKGKSAEYPNTYDVTLELIWPANLTSPRKSTNRASNKPALPQKAVWHVLWSDFQHVPMNCNCCKPDDKGKRYEFCWDLQEMSDNDKTTLNVLVCTNEATFCSSAKINCHICIQGYQNPHNSTQHEQKFETLTSSVQYLCKKSKVHLLLLIIPRQASPIFVCWGPATPARDRSKFILQQDGSLPHIHLQEWHILNVSCTVRLDQLLTEAWLCCDSWQDHLTSLPWTFVYSGTWKKLCTCHHYQGMWDSCNNAVMPLLPKETGQWSKQPGQR
jgi:hypothetical protein